VPTNRSNLASYISVDSDATSPTYGQIRVLRLPDTTQVQGPSQISNTFAADERIQNKLLGIKQSSTVVDGNLLTLPVGGGLLYVEPVYVQAEASTSFPLLRKVLVGFGDKLAFEDTLQAALDKVFAGDSGASNGGGDTGGGEPGTGDGATPNAALADALADAQSALVDAKAALAKGDFTAYGVAQAKLTDAIQRALAAEKATPKPSPSPSGTSKPSSSSSPSPSSSPSG